MLDFAKSHMSEKTLFFIFIFILLSSFLYATVINIPADQPTIQAGIDVAANGDTVLVQPGTYGENINFDGKLITIGSLFLTTQDTTYISSTIINGNNNGSVVVFENLEDSTSILTGFTIANGSGTGVYGYGGGIGCWYSSSPSLTNITVTDNSASYGAGIYCYDNSNPSLENVTISNNSAEFYGGGILCDYYSSPSLVNVTISGNTADGATGGAGMLCDHYSSPSLKNVTISGNSALEQYGSGGGIFCTHDSNPSLENVTITDNYVDNFGGGIISWGSHPVFINSILWNDSPHEIYTVNGGSVTATYSDIENGTGLIWFGTGCIDSDPIFVDPGSEDYHLQSTSPCIDAGDEASPFDPDGTIADMGAYYYDQVFNPIPLIANFTADTTNGYVPLTINFTDLSTPGSDPIDEWYWDFGNGNNSTLQNPFNEYYYRGSYTVSLTVTDVIDSTDTETKVDYITVLNSAPILQNPLIDFSFDEDTVDSSIDLNTVFDDADLPYGDILSFSYLGNTYIDVSIVSGIVTLTPDPDWFGYEDIIFTATDDSQESVSDIVRVTIDNVNDAPVINSYDPSYSPVTINETESQLFCVNASDIDGDPLTYQWYVDDVPQTGQTDSTYTHTTDYTSAGTYMIKCIVDDGVTERTFDFSRVSRVEKATKINLDSEENRATDHQEWQLIVNDSDQVIVVNDIQPAPGPVIIDEMDTIDFFFSGNDPDGNPLVYSWELDGVEVSTDSTYTFETNYTSAGEYEVTLFVTDNFGTRDELNFLWNVTVNDVSGSGEVLIPVITKLYQNHPNPFNPVTSIQFDIKENETGVLSIFNLKGQIIDSQRFNPGNHTYLWNAENCSSGVYLYKLQSESFTEIKKMLMLK